ncbi:MAG: nucleotidyltransferase domain-containing protein [Halanaeroarchaeum sp.]
MTLEDPHRGVVLTLVDRLDGTGVDWALTGSCSFALQGVPLSPNDVDVQTNRAGAYAIAETFAAAVDDPVTWSEGDRIRSAYGTLVVDGVEVELMGGVQRRRADGTWSDTVEITDHLTTVDLAGRAVPVIDLAYDARAYEEMGRSERAALLREHL